MTDPEAIANLGQATGLVATNSVDYVRRIFAFLDSGVVVVPLRSNGDTDRIQACGLKTVIEPAEEHGWVNVSFTPRESGELAQVAFTSGTEGEPKGVLLTHRNLADAVHRLQSAMGLDASVREYIGVPVYHSFGFGRCRAVAAAGGHFFVPRTGFDLRELAAMIETGDVNSVSTIPTLWRLVLRNKALFAKNGWRIRWIEVGSQPMALDEKRALRELFPRARIIQHYGLTEASRSTFLDIGLATDEELSSVGRPIGGVEIAIAEEGRIKIRGPHVASELLVAGVRVPNTDAQGWLATNDMGEYRDGNLYFLGRIDDVINISGKKVSPDLIENDMRSALGIEGGFCVARVANPLRGESVLVAARRDLGISDECLVDAARKSLASQGINARSAVLITRMAELPTTEAGKVKRQSVARQYLEGPGRLAVAPVTGTLVQRTCDRLLSPWRRRIRARPKTVREIYRHLFPDQRISDDDTFVSLGGDSLSYIEATLALEELLGELPHDWQQRPINAFQHSAKPRAALVEVDTALLLRCLCILAIVVSHFELVNLGGGTFLFIALAGFNFARFQLPNVLESNSVRSLLNSAVRIGVPTVLAMLLLEIKTGHYDLPQILLLGNWEVAATQPFSLWFLEMLVQLYVIVALLMAIPAIKTAARVHPLQLAIVLLLVTAIMAKVTPMVWDVGSRDFRIPPVLIWLFFLGWAIQRATSARPKLIVGTAIVAVPLFVWGAGMSWRNWLQYGEIWVIAGGLLLLFVSSARLPRWAHRGISLIAEASMFIYIVHWTARSNWHRIGGPEWPLLDVAIGVVAGIVALWIWKFATSDIGRALFGRSERETSVSKSVL